MSLRGGADRARVTDARHIVEGESGGDVVKSALYAIYLTIMLALTYGLTVARAVFVSEDPAALRADLLSWPAAVVAVVVAVLVVAVAFRTGRARGPVVPPLPWVDHVVASPNDRSETLRRWWLLSVLGAVTGGMVLGAVLGGGAWLAKVTGPGFLLVAVVVALALALILLVAWLAGQATVSPPYADATSSWRPDEVLRRLRTDDLRAQSARSSRIAGGVLAGDLRAVRLEVAAPVTRGRGLRLKAGGPSVVVVRRDVLGLRRMPGAAAYGLVLSLLGAAALTWCLDRREVPLLLAAIAVLPCYLGFGAFAEGLRLLGDNSGTPPLLGIPPRREAVAHLVVPTATFLVSGVVAAVGVGLLDAEPPRGLLMGALWVVPVALLLAGSHLLSAFRGQPPASAFKPQSGPTTLVLWLVMPAAVAVVACGLLTWLAARSATPVNHLLPAVVAGGLLVQIGLARARSVSEAHRR